MASYIYYDDSKHPQSGFYIGAFVYSQKDLQPLVIEAIEKCGFDSKTFEFKSGMRINGNKKVLELRSYLNRIASNTKISIVVSKGDDKSFSRASRYAFKDFLHYNADEICYPINCYFDQGVFLKRDSDYLLSGTSDNSRSIKVNLNQDSRLVGGIQIADLIAHSCSTMLKESLGHVNKQVLVKDYMDDEVEINIGWILWTTIRYKFFFEKSPTMNVDIKMDDVNEVIRSMTAIVGKNGLYVDENCDEKIIKASQERFNEMYLGCIH